MSDSSSSIAQPLSKRQNILRYGAWVGGLGTLTLYMLSQVYLFHNPRFIRMRLSFIIQDVFTLTWLLFMGLVVWKLTQKRRQAGNS